MVCPGSPASLPGGTATALSRRGDCSCSCPTPAQVLRGRPRGACQLRSSASQTLFCEEARGLQLGLQHHAHQDLALQRHRLEVASRLLKDFTDLLWQPRQPAGGLLEPAAWRRCTPAPMTGGGWELASPARETCGGDSWAGSVGGELWGACPHQCPSSSWREAAGAAVPWERVGGRPREYPQSV